MISIFQEQPTTRRGISAFAISCALHAVGFSAISYGLLHEPRIDDHIVTERYTVRHLELHEPDSRGGEHDDKYLEYPGTPVQNAQLAAKPTASEPSAEAAPPAAPATPPIPQVADGATGRQTLVQPEFHIHHPLAAEAPLPTVVIWSPELASSKNVVAPKPDAPTAATTKPSLDVPNQELAMSDQAIAATDSHPKLPTPPTGTTSPIALNTPSLVHLPPATVSMSDDQPTPTELLSISDLRMVEGAIIVPPVNETKAPVHKAAPVPAQTRTAAVAKPAKPPVTPSVIPPQTAPVHPAVPAQTPTAHPALFAQVAAAHAVAPSPTASGTPGTAPNAVAKASPASAEDDAPLPGTEHITLSKDGKFGVVVLGSSLADDYPETVQIWNGRLAYTAYLHVGLAKSWILQYSQLHVDDVSASGAVARLEAPWPYDIFRPNLISRDLNADALMIHGVVNQNGRFEHLAVAFPAQFAHASFVLRALQRWQFRPARQNGKPTAVEVLLIIPDELD